MKIIALILLVVLLSGCGGVSLGKCYTVTTQKETRRVWATGTDARNGEARELKLYAGGKLVAVFYGVESATSKPGPCPCEHGS